MLWTGHIILIVIVYSVSRNHRKKKSLTLPTGEDEAVISERRKVLRSDSTKELLVFRNLTKVYGHRCNSQNRLAVNQLCLKMQKAEVMISSDFYLLPIFYFLSVFWFVRSEWSRKDDHFSNVDW